LFEFLHFDIQSTGQKSHCVKIREGESQCYVLIKQSDSLEIEKLKTGGVDKCGGGRWGKGKQVKTAVAHHLNSQTQPPRPSPLPFSQSFSRT